MTDCSQTLKNKGKKSSILKHNLVFVVKISKYHKQKILLITESANE